MRLVWISPGFRNSGVSGFKPRRDGSPVRRPAYDYARVSTSDQGLVIQRAALEAAGCGIIRAETASGIRRDGRTEPQALLDFLHAGDTLVVTRIDRLARSLKDLRTSCTS